MRQGHLMTVITLEEKKIMKAVLLLLLLLLVLYSSPISYPVA